LIDRESVAPLDGAAMVRRMLSKASDTLDNAAEASGQVMQSVGRELTTAQKYATGAVRADRLLLRR
jgi:hypothetical protein